MNLDDLVVPPVHLRLRGRIDELTEQLALRAPVNAAHLFGLAAGTLLRRLRELNDPLADAVARATEAEFKATCFAQAAHIIGARFDKLPERKRPHYTPKQRFRILELKNLLGWPADSIARLFRVCTHTILNWEQCADPTAKTAGSTGKPTPPITRFADVVRNTLQLMARYDFGNDRAIAFVLARAGWKVSARSVARIQKERPPRKPTPPTTDTRHKTTHPVVARFVHHVWMMDVSEVQAFLGGGTLYLATVFDAFSRVPLVLQAYLGKPGASAMAKLLKAAVRNFGKAKYVITDQGGEFKGKIFQKTATRLGIIHRFGTRDRIFATARLERFWRTLKQQQRQSPPALDHRRSGAAPRDGFDLLPLLPPASGAPRRHSGRDPPGLEPACKSAVAPPRGRPGEGPQQQPFTIGLFAGVHALPILKKTA